MKIPYSPQDFAAIIQRGRDRFVYDRARGIEHRGTGEYVKEWTDDVGAIGEDAGSRMLELPIEAELGAFDAVDLSIVEVRARRYQAGRLRSDLPIKLTDWNKRRLHLPFVLVHVELEAKTAEIEEDAAWLCGWEGLARPGTVWYADQQTWYVKRPYHSLRSLKQWIACGHRPHYIPPDFYNSASLAAMQQTAKQPA